MHKHKHMSTLRGGVCISTAVSWQRSYTSGCSARQVQRAAAGWAGSTAAGVPGAGSGAAGGARRRRHPPLRRGRCGGVVRDARVRCRWRLPEHSAAAVPRWEPVKVRMMSRPCMSPEYSQTTSPAVRLVTGYTPWSDFKGWVCKPTQQQRLGAFENFFRSRH